MTNRLPQATNATDATLDNLAKLANCSLMDTLNCDPEATANGADHAPRQVFSGHYVPVKPTPIEEPEYVAHSQILFGELGFFDNLAQLADFVRMFSGDLTHVPPPLGKVGWRRATHCRSMAKNTPNSARSKPATDTAMVAQFPCLRPSSNVDAGKCS
ncbi:MAG: hypothetical protein ACI9EB_001739 [Pseudomonas sp.]|jgi:hypothetical protein